MELKDFDIIKIESGTLEGVNIPFILVLPKQLKEKNKLVTVFNNEGGESLDQSTQNIEKSLPTIIEKIQLDMPMVIPILPSKEEFDMTLMSEGVELTVGEPKQFARECFDPTIPKESKFYRIDEQVKTILKALVNDEKLMRIIKAKTKRTDSFGFEEKMVGFGHSGAGAAMLRFSLIHPELFDTLIIGGNGDIVPTPIGENARKLAYPFGIQDFFELFGREFPEDDYRKMSVQFYIGDREDSNRVFDTIRDENYDQNGSGPKFAPENLATKYKQLYGKDFFVRLKNVLMQLESAGIKVGLKIYPDDCHSLIKPEDFHEILTAGKSFEGDCAKQIQSMIDKRLLDGAKDASKGTTRSATIDEQGKIINQSCQSKDGIVK